MVQILVSELLCRSKGYLKGRGIVLAALDLAGYFDEAFAVGEFHRSAGFGRKDIIANIPEIITECTGLEIPFTIIRRLGSEIHYESTGLGQDNILDRVSFEFIGIDIYAVVFQIFTDCIEVTVIEDASDSDIVSAFDVYVNPADSPFAAEFAEDIFSYILGGEDSDIADGNGSVVLGDRENPSLGIE